MKKGECLQTLRSIALGIENSSLVVAGYSREKPPLVDQFRAVEDPDDDAIVIESECSRLQGNPVAAPACEKTMEKWYLWLTKMPQM